MGRLPTRSVRFRVTVLATAIVAFVLVVMGISIVLVQHHSLSAALDEGLGRRADDLAALAGLGVPETLAGVDDDSAAQLTTLSGEVVVSSPNLDGPVPHVVLLSGENERIQEHRLAGPDDNFRVLTRRIDTPDGSLLLHVAAATDDVSDAVGVLRSSLLVAIPAAIVALALAIWWMVGRALQPVDAIRSEVESITDTDLSRRVPVPDTDDEVARLAVTMNGMLDRIERGVVRLQRFVADASHELRSPLARIRSELEVDLMDRDQADLVATHESVREEALAMEALVGDLLFLARSDAGGHDSRNDAVDLDDIVLAEAHRLRTETPKTVDVSGVSAGQVAGDPRQLQRLVVNIAANAVRFATSAVTIRLFEDDGDVVLTVSDDGPGIEPADRDRVFDRFARTDEGRSRDQGGSGLGLAIARDIVTRHGGSIRVDPAHTDGTRFEVRLPRLVVGYEGVEHRTDDRDDDGAE